MQKDINRLFSLEEKQNSKEWLSQSEFEELEERRKQITLQERLQSRK